MSDTSLSTTKQYKATIYVEGAQRTDTIIVEAHGIRWAIEKASSQYTQKFYLVATGLKSLAWKKFNHKKYKKVLAFLHTYTIIST